MFSDLSSCPFPRGLRPCRLKSGVKFGAHGAAGIGAVAGDHHGHVGLTAVFMVVGFACQKLGSIMLIRPSLAAWLPLLIFVPVATALYDRIEK